MQQHGSKYFVRRPPLHHGGGGIPNSTFSKHGLVAYQIIWNHECSNMQVHILSLHTPSIPEVGSKVKTFFLKEFMLHIKLEGNGV